MSLQRPGGFLVSRALAVLTVAAVISASLSVIDAASATAAPSSSHEVEPGETVWEIAVRYGTSASEVAAVNGLADPDLVVDGTVLRIPGGASGPIGHVLTPGETLSHVAVRYGTTTAALARANAIADTDFVLAGTTLRVPRSTGRPAATTTQETATAVRDPSDVEALLEDAAARFGWDANLVKAIAWQESGWNNAAVSSADARGIMQVLPGTNRLVSEPRAGRRLDLSDPVDNVEAGMQYLELLVELTGGDPEAILAGYFQGVRSVNTNGRFVATERYIDNVLALRDRFASGG